MTIDQIEAIVDQYQKHDWQLRRILLPLEEVEIAAQVSLEYQDVDVVESVEAAIWFSRRSIPDNESWELRRIAPPAYALVEVLPDDLPQDAKDELLKQTELRMFSKPKQMDN